MTHADEGLGSGPTYRAAVAGALSGALATALLYPLDLVKTRLQVQSALSSEMQQSAATKSFSAIPTTKYRSGLSALVGIPRAEGFTALYKGLNVNLVGSGAAWGLYFYFYALAKEHVAHYLLQRHAEMSSSKEEDVKRMHLGARWHLGCGLAAGVVTAYITNPIWVVKTRLQLQQTAHADNYVGLLHAWRTIWREEGYRGFFKGMVPALWGTSHGAIQFMAYEEIMNYYRKRSATGELATPHHLLAGALSKAIATAVTYPYQVLRSRIQIRPLPGQPPLYKGSLDVMKHIWQTDGVVGFYRGLFVNIARVSPSAAITFALYEGIIKGMQWMGM